MTTRWSIHGKNTLHISNYNAIKNTRTGSTLARIPTSGRPKRLNVNKPTNDEH